MDQGPQRWADARDSDVFLCEARTETAMSDHDDEHGHGHGAEHDKGQMERTTAPQQDYSMSKVTTGLAVMVVGLILTFGLAFALA